MFGVDALDDLDAAIDKVAAAESGVDVARLRIAIERLEHTWHERIRAAEKRGDWCDEGFASAAAWVRERCRISHGAASAALDLARKLESLPVTSEAFARGAITRAHAQVIARAATPGRVDAIAAVEPSLVLAAESVGPKQLRDLVQHVADAIDGDGGAAAAEAQHDRRYLHVSPMLDGLVAIDGVLDAEGGELVLSALDTAMENGRGAGDLRTRPQQRADALVELCQVGAPKHAAGPGRRLRPHLTVVVDHDGLVHETAHDASHDAERGVERGVTSAPRAHAAHVGRLPMATIERLACDAGIARVVTTGKSMPIDVGRTTRTIPSALWHALVVRDGGCVVPGCDRPPGWCQAHHKVWWTRGGPTNLDNCELRCRQHHRAVHEGGADPPEP